MKSKSLFGLNENIISAIAYAGMCITGIFVYIFEKENKTVKFHGLQSTIFFGILLIAKFLVDLLLGWIPLIGGLLNFGVGLILFASWAFLIFMAYKGTTFKIPIIGDAIWEQVNK